MNRTHGILGTLSLGHSKPLGPSTYNYGCRHGVSMCHGSPVHRSFYVSSPPESWVSSGCRTGTVHEDGPGTPLVTEVGLDLWVEKKLSRRLGWNPVYLQHGPLRRTRRSGDRTQVLENTRPGEWRVSTSGHRCLPFWEGRSEPSSPLLCVRLRLLRRVR